MISSNMPYSEIGEKINSDWETLKEKIRYYEGKFLRSIAKTNKFPITKVYKLGNSGVNNTYYLSFTIQTKQDLRRTPYSTIACRAIDCAGDSLLILTPNVLIFFWNHFLERYKERVLKNKAIPFDEVVESVMLNEMSLSGIKITKEIDDVYHCFDGHYSEDKVDLLLTNPYGYCFAEKRERIVYVKTVITNEMLSEKQKKLFSQVTEIDNILNHLYYSTRTIR